MKAPKIPFSFMLPLLELLIWVVLIPTQTLVIFLHLRQTAPATGDILLNQGQFSLTISRDHLFGWVFRSVAYRYSHLIVSINIPGTIINALVGIRTAEPGRWFPGELGFDEWRALSFPFFCLPAWWFVGKGLDGMLRRSRLHWGTLLGGTALCLCFMAMALGMRFGMTPSERVDTYWAIYGMAGWAAAFAVFPLTWVWRGSSRRKLI